MYAYGNVFGGKPKLAPGAPARPSLKSQSEDNCEKMGPALIQPPATEATWKGAVDGPGPMQTAPTTSHAGPFGGWGWG